MVNAVSTDRAEQRIGETAIPAAAYDQQLGSCRRLDKDLGRVPLNHTGPQPGRALGTDDLIKNFGECLLPECGKVVVAREALCPA